MLLLILLLKGVFIFYHDAKYVSMIYASVYQCISAFRRLTLMRYLYFKPNLSTKMFIIYDLGELLFVPKREAGLYSVTIYTDLCPHNINNTDTHKHAYGHTQFLEEDPHKVLNKVQTVFQPSVALNLQPAGMHLFH